MLDIYEGTPFYPASVALEVSLRCNLSCIHCGSSCVADPNIRELSLDEWKGVVDQLAGMKTEYIVLSGGEPFVWPHWRELCKHISGTGIAFSIISNGYHITEDDVAYLKKLGICNIGLSIDGMEETHNRIRRSKDSFARVVRSVKLFRKVDILTSVSTSVNKLNYGDLLPLMKYLDEQGVDQWQVQIVNSFGRAGEMRESLLVDEGKYAGVVKFIAHAQREYKAGRIRMQTCPADSVGYCHKTVSRIWGACEWSGCSAGRYVAGIKSNGDVLGCLSLQGDNFVAGNVLERPFAEIWSADGAFAYNRKFDTSDLTGACAGCTDGAKCRGGCIGMAWSTSGELHNNRYCYKLIAKNRNNNGFENLSVAEKYVVLALAADRISEDAPIVFNYTGPADLRRLASAWKDATLSSIDLKLAGLEDEAAKLPDAYPFYRATCLRSQIRSLRGLIKYGAMKDLRGEVLAEAVTATIGIDIPPPFDEASLQREGKAVMHLQAEALARPLSDRGVREQIELLKNICTTDIVPHLFMGEELLPFLNSSSIRLARPSKGYPPCYYVYGGKGRATIVLSGDHRRTKLSALTTLMHELLPGHHLYYLYRDLLCQAGHLGVEATIDLALSAETPLNEGIAETAPYLLKSLDEAVLREIRLYMDWDQHAKRCLYNIWYRMFIEEKMSIGEAKDYLVGACGFPEKGADGWIGFADEWRLYYPSYPIGTKMMRDWLEADPKERLEYAYVPRPVSLLNNNRLVEKNTNPTQGGRYEERQEVGVQKSKEGEEDRGAPVL